jgi:hypothetical protein
MSANNKLTSNIFCCRELPVTSAVPSPFGRLICLGYYDGPTGGVAECETCLATYLFDLVAWSPEQDVRIFSLTEERVGTLDRLAEAISPLGPARWPYWCPIWKFKSQDEEEDVTKKVDLILKLEKPASVLIATVRLDKEILAAREITDFARPLLPKRRSIPPEGDWIFWSEYLSI